MKNQIVSFLKNLKLSHKIAVGIILAMIIAGSIAFSSRDNTVYMTPLFTCRISDSSLISRISLRLDMENVRHVISQDGLIYLKNKDDVKRMIAILVREDLVPGDTSPWDVFRMDSWNTTDFERNVNLRRALTLSLEQHIEALSDVDRARVTLVLPEKQLFAEDQSKVSASIIITPREGSDISVNKNKILGIVKLVKFAVEGLEDENITISDISGNILNDFTGSLRKNTQFIESAEQKIEVQHEFIIPISAVYNQNGDDTVFAQEVKFDRTGEFQPIDLKIKEDSKSDFFGNFTFMLCLVFVLGIISALLVFMVLFRGRYEHCGKLFSKKYESGNDLKTLAMEHPEKMASLLRAMLSDN